MTSIVVHTYLAAAAQSFGFNSAKRFAGGRAPLSIPGLPFPTDELLLTNRIYHRQLDRAWNDCLKFASDERT
jgi:hypothetical protein